MDTPTRDPDKAGKGPAAPTPSARVRLEVDILDSELGTAASPAASTRSDASRVVLIVSADADVRRYVREALRDRSDLRVLEAATVHYAGRLSEQSAASLLITDVPEVCGALQSMPAILITDDASDAVASSTESVAVPRPFTAERLAGLVARLLG